MNKESFMFEIWKRYWLFVLNATLSFNKQDDRILTLLMSLSGVWISFLLYKKTSRWPSVLFCNTLYPYFLDIIINFLIHYHPYRQPRQNCCNKLVIRFYRTMWRHEFTLPFSASNIATKCNWMLCNKIAVCNIYLECMRRQSAMLYNATI